MSQKKLPTTPGFEPPIFGVLCRLLTNCAILPWVLCTKDSIIYEYKSTSFD